MEGIKRAKRNVKNYLRKKKKREEERLRSEGMEVVQAEEKPKSGAAVVGPTEEELREMESMWG